MNDELLFYANETIKDCIKKAETIYHRYFLEPRIQFGIRGRVAGRACYRENLIKLNRQLFLENQDAFIGRTIIHECAHLILYALYGNEGRGHGTNWQNVMRSLGAKDITRCHHYVVKTPGRVVKREFTYLCNCQKHILTKIKHNRILHGAKYRCVRCRGHLERVMPGYFKIV